MHKLKKIQIGKMDKDTEKMVNGPSHYPPSFYVGDKQIPEIRKWKVGQKYILMVEVEMKSFEDRSIADKPKEMNASASFDILAYKPMDDEDEDYENMSDEDVERVQGKALANKI